MTARQKPGQTPPAPLPPPPKTTGNQLRAIDDEIAKLGAVRRAFDQVFGTGGCDDDEGAPPK